MPMSIFLRKQNLPYLLSICDANHWLKESVNLKEEDNSLPSETLHPENTSHLEILMEATDLEPATHWTPYSYLL